MLVRQRLLSPEILKKVKDSERINTEKLWKKYHFHCHNYFLKTPYQMGILLKPSENAFLFKILMRISHLQLFLQRKYRSSWPDVFCKKSVLKIFTKYTGKRLCTWQDLLPSRSHVFSVERKLSEIFLVTQQTLADSNSTIETQEKVGKYIDSSQDRH